MANVVFLFNNSELAIQCTKEDKMKDICNRFAIKNDKNINSLIFLYGGSKVNYELTFKQQANSIDNNINQMKIIVCQNENDGLKCKKCGETIHLDILDNLVKYNNEQKDTLIEMKNQINNIIDLNNINDIIRKIKLIKIILDNLISENEKNLKNIQNVINNSDIVETKNNNYNFELISEYNMQYDEKQNLKSYIEESIRQYSDYKEISKSIHNYCQKIKVGNWSVITGDRDKFKAISSANQGMVGNIGPYRISISMVKK